MAADTAAGVKALARGHSWCTPAAAASASTSGLSSCTSQLWRTAGSSAANAFNWCKWKEVTVSPGAVKSGGSRSTVLLVGASDWRVPLCSWLLPPSVATAGNVTRDQTSGRSHAYSFSCCATAGGSWASADLSSCRNSV